MKYRSDIDGLRAIAVIPVVLFHSGLTFFSGGFVGVDVFFVISGYLITLIIAEEIKAGQFSIINFYERRVRRIFPALFTVMLFTTIVSSIVLMPSSFDSFGRSLVSATLFASNMLFWNEVDYFDASALSKPLLHTWSLGVEEQFYIFFPLVLVITHRLKKFHWSYVLVPGAILSLVLAEYYVTEQPALAFYWAPMRAWELFLGAFVALGLFPEVRNNFIREFTSLLGLAMIAVPVFAFTEDTLFPGTSALLPCMGAVLLINAGRLGSSVVTRMISIRPLVFVGLISYSLYLWHWPLIVFTKTLLIDQITLPTSLLIVMASFLCAFLSWRFIEKPFRTKQNTQNVKLFSLWQLAGTTMTVFVLIGLSIDNKDGYPERLTTELNQVLAAKRSINPMRTDCFGYMHNPLGHVKQCVIGDAEPDSATVYLWGDSHADSLYGTFKYLFDSFGINTLYAADASCLPLLGIGKTSACIYANQEKLKFILEAKEIKYVVLAARWTSYLFGRAVDLGPAEDNRNRLPIQNAEGKQYKKFSTEEQQVFQEAFLKTIAKLLEAGKTIVLVYPIPEVGYDVPNTLAQMLWQGRNINSFTRPLSYFDQRHSFVFSLFSQLKDEEGVIQVFPHKMLCDMNECIVSYDGKPLYRDNNHLSIAGGRYIAPVFKDMVEKIQHDYN